jgi:glycosyltransferase involved in cell wall biosynthesis
MSQLLKYTVVVPTYNEEKDIEETLKYLMALNYDNYDVIIVDDSTDNTPNIIKKYENEKLRLIIPTERKGRSEARNIGIKATSCDIVIILNADVHLPSDFLNRIDVHYKNGYDAVACYNQVENTKEVYSRFLEMRCLDRVYRGVYQKRKETIKYFWTEGFSVKKDLLMKTSLFPSNAIVPIVAGEDVRLIDELRGFNCNGIYDETIIVPHIAPFTFKEFWSIRVGRGEGTPQVRRFIDKWSFSRIGLYAALKLIRRFFTILLIVPLFIQGYKLSRHSFKNKFLELFSMSYVYALEQVALSYGEVKSFFNVYHKTKEIK